jgi:ABC-2 type transport system ATP-binding protein
MNHYARLFAKQLTKSYGDVHALRGIDINIDRPGVFAVLGQNGAGKTSLIKCALGLEPIGDGQLTTMGHAPGSMTAKQQTGVILQDTDLPDTLTVKEHIALFASYYPQSFSVNETIAMCELSSFAHKKYKQLSGGQKRRVQFALAVVGDPELIFLDEPTTGLDIEARRNLWAVIREFANKGKTIVLTTHYLEEADNLADQIMIMNQGQIVANATPANIHKQSSGSIVRCQTSLNEQQIQKLAGVEAVSISGRFSEIRTSKVNQTVAELLALAPDLLDLTVSKPKLEDIFTQLSNPDLKQSSSSDSAGAH